VNEIDMSLKNRPWAGAGTSFEGKAGAFKSFSGQEPLLLLGALAAVYMSWPCSTKATCISLTILRAFRPRASCLSALCDTDDSLHDCVIGIILLIES